MFRNIPVSNPNFAPPKPISLFIKEYCSAWSVGKHVLCIGDSEGSNALFLGKKGVIVEVLELSTLGVFDIYKHVSSSCIEMTLRHTTLERWAPKPLFHGIVCTFVSVPKHEQIHFFEKCFEALYPGGVLVAELFSESQKSFPSNGFGYDLNHTLRILKTLPCTLDKFSQEIILYKEEERLKASVLHIVATKTTS